MITIRSSEHISEPTLIGLEASLTTPFAAYEFSSDGCLFDPTTPGGLFGAISWPRSRFRLGPNLILEQQMFLPHESSDVAISWELRGELIPARLIVRPYFAGCAPRSFRDTGFRYDSEQNGGRLAWLPNVRGPKILADTNGQYIDEPAFSENPPTGREGLVACGAFEFALNGHPSLLIFSTDDYATARRQFHVGAFLANFLSKDRESPPMARLEAATHAELVAA